MSKYHELPFIRYRYEGNTQNTPKYVRTMDLYITNIDKNDKNTWRTIYEAIDAPYFGEVGIFSIKLTNQYKIHPNETQKKQLIT